MKSLHELIVELETWISHLRHHAETVPPTQANPAPQSAPVEVATPKPATGSDNPMLDAYKQSNPQYVEPSKGPVTPAIDLSAPELDFSKVQGGVHIPLPKTITGCPDKVNVMAVITVNSGGVEKYTITVNGQSVTVPNAQNEFISANYFPVNGPTVTVSADVPGMEMMIYRG